MPCCPDAGRGGSGSYHRWPDRYQHATPLVLWQSTIQSRLQQITSSSGDAAFISDRLREPFMMKRAEQSHVTTSQNGQISPILVNHHRQAAKKDLHKLKENGVMALEGVLHPWIGYHGGKFHAKKVRPAFSEGRYLSGAKHIAGTLAKPVMGIASAPVIPVAAGVDSVYRLGKAAVRMPLAAVSSRKTEKAEKIPHGAHKDRTVLQKFADNHLNRLATTGWKGTSGPR